MPFYIYVIVIAFQYLNPSILNCNFATDNYTENCNKRETNNYKQRLPWVRFYFGKEMHQ